MLCSLWSTFFGLKIFRSQELLPVSLETCVQYGGGEITRVRLNETRFGPSASFAGMLDSAVRVLGLLIVIHVFLCKNIHKLDFFFCVNGFHIVRLDSAL
jgi:malate/lactate dehydrogenase